jgi:hypothetical protein
MLDTRGHPAISNAFRDLAATGVAALPGGYSEVAATSASAVILA